MDPASRVEAILNYLAICELPNAVLWHTKHAYRFSAARNVWDELADRLAFDGVMRQVSSDPEGRMA